MGNWSGQAQEDQVLLLCSIKSCGTVLGRLWSRSRRRTLFLEAALKVMSYLPLPYFALGALLVVPRPLRDAVYDHIAKKRYDWFGKKDECLVTWEQNTLDCFIDRDEILERS